MPSRSTVTPTLGSVIVPWGLQDPSRSVRKAVPGHPHPHGWDSAWIACFFCPSKHHSWALSTTTCGCRPSTTSPGGDSFLSRVVLSHLGEVHLPVLSSARRPLASVTPTHLSVVKRGMCLPQESGRHPFSFLMFLEAIPLPPSLHVLEMQKSDAFPHLWKL